VGGSTASRAGEVAVTSIQAACSASSRPLEDGTVAAAFVRLGLALLSPNLKKGILQNFLVLFLCWRGKVSTSGSGDDGPTPLSLIAVAASRLREAPASATSAALVETRHARRAEPLLVVNDVHLHRRNHTLQVKCLVAGFAIDQ
jgi:hypothetical protein